VRLLAKIGLSFTLLSALAVSGVSGAHAAGDEPKPVIGLNCDVSGDKPRELSVQTTYVDAITRAGGIPILLPPMSEDDLKAILPTIDGVCMIGGADYPPASYGQKPHQSVSLMAHERSDFDLTLVRNALAEKNLAFLGICAGCQALNIGSGGTLTQDIPSQRKTKVMHASPQGWQKGFNKHDVTFVKDSHLGQTLGLVPVSEPTSHHQCVETPGQDLKVTATTQDGLIEGIEMPDRPFVVGVQFHPERSYDRNQALFNDFISAAKKHREARKPKISL
jgi:putative glutamine amidotransferase